MIAMVCLLASCLSNDDETVTYNDTAVTSFTLGSIRCYRTVKTAAGKDSTYSYSYSGSSVRVYIDQVNRRIFNEDSLAVGSDLSRVITTISTKNNGVALLKNLDDGNWTLYSSSDSIDYTKERVLRVVSSDGQHSTDYTVNIVCHKEFADSFSWSRMPGDARIAAFTKMRAAQAGGLVYLMGTDDSGAMTLLRSADGSAWTACAMPATDMMGATMAGVGGELKVYAAGTLYSTEDGETWTATTPSVPLKTLAGGCGSEMYAIGTDGKIMVSGDGGTTWEQDAMESGSYVDNTGYLPATDISVIATATRTNSDVTNVTMVGNKAYTGEEDTFASAVVWNKIVDKDAPQVWTYTNIAWDNYAYRLPRMEGMAAVGYADGILAIGGAPVNGTSVAYSKLYYSPDRGATWHTQSSMNVPEGFASAKVATIVEDGKGCFYLIGANASATSEDEKCMVWRGKQNKVLWKPADKYYE